MVCSYSIKGSPALIRVDIASHQKADGIGSMGSQEDRYMDDQKRVKFLKSAFQV